MLVHAGGETGAARLLRRGARRATASSAAPSWSRSRSTSRPTSVAGLQRRRRLVRGARDARGAGARRRALRHACRWPSCAAPAARLARDGVVVNGEQAYFFEILAPILTHYEEARESTRRAATCSARASCSASPSSATRSSGSAPRAPSPSTRARSRRRSPTGCSSAAGRSGAPTSPPTSRSPASRSRASFRGREVLTNPPPSSGGILIAFALALLERAGGATTWSGRRRDGGRSRHEVPRLHARSSSPALYDAAERSPARFLRARRRRLGSTTHITAVDGDGMLRERHLLERDRLGADRPRHRRPRQQHARRGGPEPARLPPPRPGPAAAVDDVADRRPARRRAGGRARQRRLQPDPLGGAPDDRAPVADGLDVAEAVVGAPGPLRGRRRAGRARGRRGRARPGSRAAATRSSAGPTATSSSAASTRSRATRRRGELAAAATRGAAAPWRWREPRR